MAWPKGRGRAPGSGKPKGFVFPSTISKEQGRDALRTLVLRKLAPLVNAQLDNALGLNHFFLRDSNGRFERITNPDQILQALNSPGAKEGSTFYIHTKDPSIQAFTDLMNRALDKPKEQEIAVAVTHSVDDRIKAARRRLGALSPSPETLTALSPVVDSAVSRALTEAKAPPNE